MSEVRERNEAEVVGKRLVAAGFKAVPADTPAKQAQLAAMPKLLFTTKTQTLSILIYHQWDNGSWQSVSCLALIFSAVLFIVGILGRALFGLGRT